MKYQVLGCETEFDRITLHESDNYDEAKSWVVGYVRLDGLKQSGYDHIAIRESGTDYRSRFDDYGWTHY